MESKLHQIADDVDRKHRKELNYNCMEKRHYSEDVRKRVEGE